MFHPTLNEILDYIKETRDAIKAIEDHEDSPIEIPTKLYSDLVQRRQELDWILKKWENR